MSTRAMQLTDDAAALDAEATPAPDPSATLMPSAPDGMRRSGQGAARPRLTLSDVVEYQRRQIESLIDQREQRERDDARGRP